MKALIVFTCLAVLTCGTFAQSPEKLAANIRNDIKPFRMSKINLIWEKALKSDLTDSKLEILRSELKMQDKQEITAKKFRAEGSDKDGKVENQLRKSLSDIMNRYGLGHSSDTASERKQMNAIFKDKKLNRLWEKAEMSGFTQEELKVLKEEFDHHQEKINQYYDVLHGQSVSANDLDSEEDKYNDHLSSMEEEEKASLKHENAIRGKHRDLKDGYNRLHKLAAAGPQSKEFVEPKVSGLWKLAANSDFTQEELESLHTELKHYESRLMKVRYLTAELLQLHKTGESDDAHPDPEIRIAQKLEEVSESEGEKLMKERYKKQRRTVEKLHEHLEQRIIQRHSEL